MGAQRTFHDIDPGRDVPRNRGASRRPSEVLSWRLSHLRRDHPIRRFLNDRLQPQHLAIHARVYRFEPSWNRGGPLVVIEGKGVSSLRRSEEHTSELQSQFHLVCRLLLEKKKSNHVTIYI